MGDSQEGRAEEVVCYVCGKAWPADTEVCPEDGTYLNDATQMDPSMRPQKRKPSVGDFDFGLEPTHPPDEPAPRTSAERIEVDAATVMAQAAAVKPDEDLPRGTLVGEYEIEGKIGEGAMGAVYRAVHPTIGRHVAIKVISPQILMHPDAVSRFVAEARAVAAIRHPGIVHVFGFGRLSDGRTYLTMEWLEGMSLGARLRQAKLPFEEAIEVLRQISKALEAAHAKNIVHRDLKPENVFLQMVEGEAPLVKLLDFGLAKVTKDDGTVARTRTGQILGTPLYMSPEQCKAKAVDERTDIYALGCMAYELLVGKVPFDFDNAAELMSAHLTIEPPHVREAAPDVPEGLDDLIWKMMAKDPAQRPSLIEVRLAFSTQLMRASMPMGAVTIEDAPGGNKELAAAKQAMIEAVGKAFSKKSEPMTAEVGFSDGSEPKRVSSVTPAVQRPPTLKLRVAPPDAYADAVPGAAGATGPLTASQLGLSNASDAPAEAAAPAKKKLPVIWIAVGAVIVALVIVVIVLATRGGENSAAAPGSGSAPPKADEIVAPPEYVPATPVRPETEPGAPTNPMSPDGKPTPGSPPATGPKPAPKPSPAPAPKAAPVTGPAPAPAATKEPAPAPKEPAPAPASAAEAAPKPAPEAAPKPAPEAAPKPEPAPSPAPAGEPSN